MAATQSAETALLPSRILAMQEMVPKRTAVGQPSRAATAPEFAPTPPGVEPALSELEFPGCYARPMTVAEYDEYEGRIEFFDSRAGIAWLAREAAHFPHERPLNMFGPLLREIGMTRGSQIVCGAWSRFDGPSRTGGRGASSQIRWCIWTRRLSTARVRSI